MEEMSKRFYDEGGELYVPAGRAAISEYPLPPNCLPR
jgi:hypothetical protein